MADALVSQLLARCRFPAAGTPVVCGLSGGADSTALVVLAVAAGCRPRAVHVDHRLRPESAAEADVAAATCRRFGVPFRSVAAPVEQGPNLEARARHARHEVLGDGALLGHTADDQAETVLVNLLRGAGIDGLAGMSGDRRPLLALRHRETVELCRHLDLQTVDDPSNRDPRFVRNRIRHEVIPLLADIAQRDVVAVLARQTSLAAAEARLLDELAAGIDPTDARALAGAPVALARRVVRRWLRAEHPPDAATVERVLKVARLEATATDVGGGRRVVRSAGRLRLEDPAGGEPAAEGRGGDR